VVAKVIGLALLTLIAAALIWGAAEQHYRACVEARFVAGTGTGTGVPRWDDQPSAALSNASVSGCSRSPF
jgi:hypothetical protein